MRWAPTTRCARPWCRTPRVWGSRSPSTTRGIPPRDSLRREAADMLENLLQKWASLAPRDRRMLIIAGCFLLVIIFWQVLLEPAWVGRQRLQKTLPTLRADLAQMDHMAAEARELANAADAPAETVAQVTVRLEQSLLARGMDKEAAKVQAQGDIIEVRFHQAPFENWIFWLDAAVRETRTRIVDLSVTRESPGVFSGRLALEMARRGK
ncbi:MAG: type II secretion system protein M [Lautropia sp.]|nr:MAG: type II secretion system protein M [Lautropia sp.]RKW39797.1 MAG: type II secretion system protein M [Lautropia sp.]